ncbi:dihydroorotate oxidase A [Ekhidna lutea]|uniref:Dihydroorotate dehydrogenase (quinone) n=1 Tax=Ekhidna lutea TaxID=447679 RepID=A0A239JXK3_EKHLU|nr:quinone-dependent dihydroorotate dehydrogenase [Ekhidna lutea]SNT10706.1 dihydroorotate oxidase A [Ekhidna lutea]
MYQLLKPVLFLFTPEKAHKITTGLLHFLLKLPFGKSLVKGMFNFQDQRLEREVFGLKFKNPVGLAAGFDKNAELIDDFTHLGFGFIEIGTLTPKGQPGNPQPRLFRLPKDEALINRMGFNNEGVESAVERLKSRKSKILVGGNIGKNKVTPNENALDDYLICFEKLYDYVDYFVVNVSSPNTPGLRELQEKEPLMKLLEALQDANKKKEAPKPILLKIAPDLTESQLDDIIEITQKTGLDGLIVSNTTIDRSGLKTDADNVEAIGPGGLSGKPVFDKSNEVLKYIRRHLPLVHIIAVGGIHSAHDAVEKIQAGANLVQIYTGLVYEGPGLIKRINKELLKIG